MNGTGTPQHHLVNALLGASGAAIGSLSWQNVYNDLSIIAIVLGITASLISICQVIAPLFRRGISHRSAITDMVEQKVIPQILEHRIIPDIVNKTEESISKQVSEEMVHLMKKEDK